MFTLNEFDLQKQQKDLGLEYGKELDITTLTNDEFSAIFYIKNNQQVPEELKDRILASKNWKVPLVSIFFEAEKVGDYHYFLVTVRERSYLKIGFSWMEQEKFKKLREDFLRQWGVPFNEFTSGKVKVSEGLYGLMQKQLVEFTGYITTEDVENFVNKKDKNAEFLDEKDFSNNWHLANEIIHEMVEAHMIKEEEERFVYQEMIHKLKFLPIENLEKILSMNYRAYRTVSEWFQAIQEQGLLQFAPYLYREKDTFFIVLAYDKYFIWSKENKIQLISTKGNLSADREEVNHKVYNFIEKMLENKTDSTKLLQVLFYMCMTNTGVLSREFRNMLSKKTNGLLNNFVKTSGEHHLFEQFTFQFFDFVPYFTRYMYDQFSIHSDIKNVKWQWFRVPADNLDYDLCRIGIGSSLKVIMEYIQDNDCKELVIVNLEPLLEEMTCLSAEEKQKILENSDIATLLVTFTLSLINVNITKTETYITKVEDFKKMKKSENNFPILFDLTDLGCRLFERKFKLAENSFPVPVAPSRETMPWERPVPPPVPPRMPMSQPQTRPVPSPVPPRMPMPPERPVPPRMSMPQPQTRPVPPPVPPRMPMPPERPVVLGQEEIFSNFD